MLHVSDIRLQKCGFKIKFCFYLYSASTCAEWRHWDVKIIVYIYIYIYFIFCGPATQRGLWLPHS